MLEDQKPGASEPVAGKECREHCLQQPHCSVKIEIPIQKGGQSAIDPNDHKELENAEDKKCVYGLERVALCPDDELHLRGTEDRR